MQFIYTPLASDTAAAAATFEAKLARLACLWRSFHRISGSSLEEEGKLLVEPKAKHADLFAGRQRKRGSELGFLGLINSDNVVKRELLGDGDSL